MLAKLISALYDIKDSIKRYLDKHEQEVEDAREEGYNEGYDEGYNDGESESQQGTINYPLGFIPPDAIMVSEGNDQYVKLETYQEIYDYVSASTTNANNFLNTAKMLYKDNTIDVTKCPYEMGLEGDSTVNGYFIFFRFNSTISKILHPSPIQGYYILYEGAES